MFFLKRRRKKAQLDESFDKVIQEIKELDESDNPALIRRYVMDSCEHIVSMAKEVEAHKASVAHVESYRRDVHILEDLSVGDKARIRDTISNIINLTQKKKNFAESERRLENDTFILLQENEDHIVEDIKRIESNEILYSKANKDVKVLEATKNAFEIDREELNNSMVLYRRIIIAIFAMVVGAVLTGLFIPGGMTGVLRLIFLGVIFTFVLVAFLIFIQMGNCRKEYRNVIKQLNSTISLLNVERMKLVNIKKALDFELKYYDVISSVELTYLWEQYLLMVKEMEAERRNNIDLTYYVDRMYSLLKGLNLNYEKRWVEQISLFLNDDELSALAAKLDERIADINLAITTNNNSIDLERREIDRLMREHDFYVPEVMEILNHVDGITGKRYSSKKGSV